MFLSQKSSEYVGIYFITSLNKVSFKGSGPFHVKYPLSRLTSVEKKNKCIILGESFDEGYQLYY